MVLSAEYTGGLQVVIPYHCNSLPVQYHNLFEDGALWVLKHDGTSGGDGVVVVDSIAATEAAMDICRLSKTDSQVLGSQEVYHFALQRCLPHLVCCTLITGCR